MPLRRLEETLCFCIVTLWSEGLIICKFVCLLCKIKGSTEKPCRNTVFLNNFCTRLLWKFQNLRFLLSKPAQFAPNKQMSLIPCVFDIFQAWIGGPPTIGQKVLPNDVFYIRNLGWSDWVSKHDFWMSSCFWLCPPKHSCFCTNKLSTLVQSPKTQ